MYSSHDSWKKETTDVRACVGSESDVRERKREGCERTDWGKRERARERERGGCVRGETHKSLKNEKNGFSGSLSTSRKTAFKIL